MSRALAFALVAVAAACTAGNGGQGFFVNSNSAPMGTTCSFTGAAGQATLSQGQLSTSSPTTGYVFTPLLQSKLVAVMNQDPALKTITIQGARVDLAFLQVETISPTGVATPITPNVATNDIHFQVFAGAALAPMGTANISAQIVPWEVIPQLTAGVDLKADKFHALIDAHVTFFGLEGGSEIDAEPFDYGVTLCNDCVVNVLGACPSTGMAPRPGNPCNPFQDGIVDCCTEASGALTCPARTM
jgi:hypothetical protein